MKWIVDGNFFGTVLRICKAAGSSGTMNSYFFNTLLIGGCLDWRQVGDPAT